jgi:antitoxin MazE
VARKDKNGDYSYSRTAKIRGREDEGRYAVIDKGREHTRVVRRRADGTTDGRGELILTSDLIDLKPTLVVPTGQRGTVTLPGEFRRNLGIEDGTPLEIIQEDDGRLSVRPLTQAWAAGRPIDLDELIRGITPENLHGEWEIGPAVGREEW